ncbi:hypothetical protein HELRODRAFT_179168 [Helobdella robusta]|uniref:Uncharacterized protein n=1 Tax=Helobdella robusta TaxID=6412 RepID=T1FEA6_HELRO|nr:hypothetical protein HELRODRAFT_179168 [Helobdella robusta]ESN95694.1 hypothetical protein HELRODRAFT_179168 [Helobdella robusta]
MENMKDSHMRSKMVVKLFKGKKEQHPNSATQPQIKPNNTTTDLSQCSHQEWHQKFQLDNQATATIPHHTHSEIRMDNSARPLEHNNEILGLTFDTTLTSQHHRSSIKKVTNRNNIPRRQIGRHIVQGTGFEFGRCGIRTR